MRMVGVLPAVIGTAAAAVAFVVPGASSGDPAEVERTAVPEQLASYSHLTGDVSDSPPGAAVALFQHGWGVEFLDFPQAVVLGAGGDVYRRVDVAEDRAGGETQGDPAPMLLSPDGTAVAVGDHDTDAPDIVVVDLVSGTTTTHPLPTGRSVVPLAWSYDGRTLVSLLTDDPTNPYSGERITGDLGMLDLTDGTAEVMDADGEATAVAFSIDGSELAVEERTAEVSRLSVVDLASGDRRDLEADGVLAGPTAWSPDGRLLATTTVRPSGAPPEVDDPGIPTGLAFVDATGRDGEVPPPLELPLPGAGRVLGWTEPDEVLLLLDVEGYDPCCGPDASTLSGVPLDGAEPRTLMRIADLQSYGVGRFQVASATVDDLRVTRPEDVDRGPWPLPWRGALALVVGLVAWLGSRALLRRRGAYGARAADDAPETDRPGATSAAGADEGATPVTGPPR
ncbi:MAG TPA: hypothetical protein VLK03_00185 [Nocardioides sp.]|nr:hypothetical protein [Nocardioides sp.]